VSTRVKTIEEAVENAKDGRDSMVLCPAHDDSSPSLHVSPGTSQPVVFKCHAGCETDAIVEAAGLNWADVCAPMEEQTWVRPIWTPVGGATRVWHYTDAQGTVLFEVLRVDLPGGKKRIIQRQPDPAEKSGYRWNLDGVQRVLYKLPEVIEAVANGRTIHITEGEKCADMLQPLLPKGDVSTTNPMGAGKWMPQFCDTLAGAKVCLYADSDETGRAHMREVRRMLTEAGCVSITTFEAPSGVIARTGKAINDVADAIEAGMGLGDLLEVHPDTVAEQARTGVDVLELVKRPRGQVEFVIDNTLAKGERLVLIGFEGQGKSTLCRQVAVMVAAGIHPFTHLAMKEPKHVMFIDAENHPDQTLESWQQLVGLAARHGFPVQPGMLTILEEHLSQPDLTSPEGTAWLVERTHAYRPDLIVMGPLTNLADRDLRDDEPVRRLLRAVDASRSICNSAFVMEHHAPHKGAGDRERHLRPYGSSLLLKKPDYGYGIKPTEEEGIFEWFKNRGPRVRSREWPEALREGVPNTLDWPWMPSLLPEDMR
jgi:hypothetical protein